MELILIHGIPVRTSSELREQLKSELMKNKFPSKEKIIKMVDDKIIIPIEAINNKYYMMLLKLIGKDLFTNTFGYYFRKKIYIVYHNTFKEFRNPVKTTIHECMHYLADIKKKEFYEINFDILKDFYLEYFKEYLQLKDTNKKIISLFLRNLIEIEGAGFRIPHIDLYKYSKIVDILNPLIMNSTLTQEEYSSKLDSIKSYIFKRLRKKSVCDIIYLVGKPIQNSYKKVFNINIPGQFITIDIFVPGEIIAKLSAHKLTHPNIVKTLNLL